MNRYGDGLVTLLMLALGLGCLNLVVHGLIDGAVDGARGASFAFASKPVKFVLIELLWLGLGLIFLLGAWRGVSRKSLDVDDEQDEQEDDFEVTRPVRLRVAPLAGPSGVARATRSATVAGPPSLTIARPLQPLTLPTVPNLNANPAAAISKAAAPKPLALSTSRFYAVLMFVFSTLFVMGSAYTALALSSAFGKALAAILFAPSALVCVITIAQCLRNFFWKGPVLVLDQFGITNYRKGGHLIPWTEVDAARLDAKYSATYLMLRFRHSSDVHAHFGKVRWLEAIGAHLFYKGFEGRVKLTSLAFKRSSVLKTTQAFIRYSRR